MEGQVFHELSEKPLSGLVRGGERAYLPTTLARSFSKLLAGRYLNPLRNTVSVITLVLVIGVALGVTTLMVVLGVMKGLESEMKNRIVGLTPHITVSHYDGEMLIESEDWGDVLDRLIEHPDVETGFGLIEHYALMDINGQERPIRYRSVNTEEPDQVTVIEELLDKEGFPESSAEMGFEKEGVFSAALLKALRLQIGDKVNLYTPRGAAEVKQVYKQLEFTPAHEQYAEQITALKKELEESQSLSGELEVYPLEDLVALDDQLIVMQKGEIRSVEVDQIEEARWVLAQVTKTGVKDQRSLPKGSVEAFAKALDGLASLDLEREDNKSLREIKDFVLPRDIVVRGAYVSSAHIAAPDVFLPLVFAQELKGLEDGLEQIALKLKDPYEAGRVVEELRSIVPEGWYIKSWQSDYTDYLSLVATEQKMMSFVLSIVMVIVTFCIGAVMFTVTLQKRQEIGVMKALGATERQIQNVFLIQGVIVGIIGVVAGLLLGWVIIENRGAIQDGLAVLGADVFPAAVHGLNEIPAEVTWQSCAWISLGSFVLCILAAIIPARVAAANDPARSLRGL